MLATPLVYSSTIRQIPIPAQSTVPTGSSRLSGWGQTSSGGIIPQMPNILQKAVLPLLTVERNEILINNSCC